MKRSHFRILAFVSLGILAGFGLHFAFPSLLERVIQSRLKDLCSGACEIQFSDVSIQGSPLRIQFEELDFSYIEGKKEKVEFFAEEVTIPDPMGTFIPMIQELEKSHGRIEFHEMRFLYTAFNQGNPATLEILSLNGAISREPSKKNSEKTPVKGDFKGIVSGSGELHLTLQSPLFSPEPPLDLGLEIKNQDLSEVNSYFSPADGIILKGNLRLGSGTVKVSGDALSLNVDLKTVFENLEIEAQKTKDRSGIETFFLNRFAELKFASDNLERKHQEQKTSLHLEREKDESLVSFILRGLKEAAFTIASS